MSELIKKLASESLKSKWNKITKNKIKQIDIVKYKCSFCDYFYGRRHECVVPILLCKECFPECASKNKTLMSVVTRLIWNIDDADREDDYTDYKELEDYYKRGVYLIHKSLKQLSKNGVLDKKHVSWVEAYIITKNDFMKIYEEEFEKRNDVR